MTSRSGQTWFVPRMSRTNPPYRKGIVPVSPEGWRCFRVFVVGLLGSFALGFGIPLIIMAVLPPGTEMIIGGIVGLVVLVAGTAWSMMGLFARMRDHTDHTDTYDAWRARQAKST